MQYDLVDICQSSMYSNLAESDTCVTNKMLLPSFLLRHFEIDTTWNF